MRHLARYKNHLLVLFSILFWVGLWWLIAALFQKPLLLPTPIGMLKALVRLAKTGEFYLTLLLSLSRILLGIVAALLFGALLALLTVKSSFCHHLFSPLLNLFKATPVASVIFLLLLWVGRDWVPALIAFMMALPIVWGNVREGLLSTDRQLLEMAQIFRVPTSRVLLQIRIPSLKSYFLAAARSSIALAWKAGIAAEVLATPARSIGGAIYEGKQFLLTDELFAWTFIVVLLSILIEWVALQLLKKSKGEASNTQKQPGEVEA